MMSPEDREPTAEIARFAAALPYPQRLGADLAGCDVRTVNGRIEVRPRV